MAAGDPFTRSEELPGTPATPVTLTFDNGAGLVFKRTIAVDADYMFTVTDTVDNTGTAPVTLSVVQDRLRLGGAERGRIAEAIEAALHRGHGRLAVHALDVVAPHPVGPTRPARAHGLGRPPTGGEGLSDALAGEPVGRRGGVPRSGDHDDVGARRRLVVAGAEGKVERLPLRDELVARFERAHQGHLAVEYARRQIGSQPALVQQLALGIKHRQVSGQAGLVAL